MQKMSMYCLSKRSLKNLEGVHPDLQEVVKLAIQITGEDFAVIEGLRTKERQRQLVEKGASKTLNSRHLTGHAVDLAWWKNGGINWSTAGVKDFYDVGNAKQYNNIDYSGYQEIGVSMIHAAAELKVPLRWGGDWDGDGQHTDHTFLDWVHFELPKAFYG